MADAVRHDSSEEKTGAIEGKRVRFKDSKDSKDAAQSGRDGLSDMDTDELEELVD